MPWAASGKTRILCCVAIQPLIFFIYNRAIGGLAKKFSTYEMLHKTNVVYPLAAARKFSDALAPHTGSEGPFHFVYTSGALAERNPQKQLWTMRDSRLVKVSAAVKRAKAHKGQDALTMRLTGRSRGCSARDR